LEMRRVREIIIAHGHENIRALHPSTMEITTSERLTPRGDCIIAVGADKAICDLSQEFKELARRMDATIIVRIIAGGIMEEVIGKGHPNLTFEDDESIVIRKSGYLCPRTLMIKANKAARDLRRDLVNLLRSKETIVRVEIEVLAD